MKSRKLLSVVLSLIMVLGVTVGSVYAQTDNEIDIDDRLDKFCNMTDEEKRDLISKYDKQKIMLIE